MFQKFRFQIKTIFGYHVINKISVNMSNKKISFFHGRLFDRITVSTVPWDPWEEVLYYSLADCEGSVKKLFHHAFSVSGII